MEAWCVGGLEVMDIMTPGSRINEGPVIQLAQHRSVAHQTQIMEIGTTLLEPSAVSQHQRSHGATVTSSDKFLKKLMLWKLQMEKKQLQMFSLLNESPASVAQLANTLVVLSSTAEDGEIEPGMRVNGSNQRLEIFCYAGVPKHFLHIFQTAKVRNGSIRKYNTVLKYSEAAMAAALDSIKGGMPLHINLDPSKFDHYEGPTPDTVWKAYEEARLAWTFDPLSWKRNDFTLNPFNTSCIGVIATREARSLTPADKMQSVNQEWEEFKKSLVGAAEEVCETKLRARIEHNALFFYLCGIIVGISTSLLLLFYLVQKMLPKSRLLYGLALGCSTLGIFVFHSLWQYVHSIIFEYSNQVLTYILVTGLVSFVMCYRMGPPTDPRSRNIIKWTIQMLNYYMGNRALSLALIFYSSFFKELVSAIMTLTAVLHYFPPGLSEKAISYWDLQHTIVEVVLCVSHSSLMSSDRMKPRAGDWAVMIDLLQEADITSLSSSSIVKKRQFPPKVKLLTEEEYLQQGVEETKKALDELKGYCSSPDCNTWKTIRKIKHPDRQVDKVLALFIPSSLRFIEFMNDSSHVSSEEILAYEMDLRHTSNDLFTDDENSSDDEQVSQLC
uniref:Uncharacterized protein n=1 Tax=Timema bartmani TaxID=61472 RepID=A0A7R9I0B4_9NEOP|nr:unnamed protein product [Timema bartmani]